MKRYAFVDWELIHSTPLKHVYRLGWQDLVKARRNTPPVARSMRRHLSIEWDGRNRLTLRAGKLLASTSSWQADDLQGIVFGIREHHTYGDKRFLPPCGWLWFIHLTGKSCLETQQRAILAELLVAHQHDAPSTSRALVPHHVQELLKWLEHCTRQRAHGPVLITNETSRREILSHVD